MGKEEAEFVELVKDMKLVYGSLKGKGKVSFSTIPKAEWSTLPIESIKQQVGLVGNMITYAIFEDKDKWVVIWK